MVNVEHVAAAKKLLRVIEFFRLIHGTMRVHQIVMFLNVATDEGRGVADYARRTGVSQSVASRHLLDIGSETRVGEPGLGLIFTKRSPTDLKKLEHYLTERGKRLLAQIDVALMQPDQGAD